MNKPDPLNYLRSREDDDATLSGLRMRGNDLAGTLRKCGATSDWFKSVRCKRGIASYTSPTFPANLLDIIELARCRFLIEHYDGQGLANDPELREKYAAAMTAWKSSEQGRALKTELARRTEAKRKNTKLSPERYQSEMDKAWRDQPNVSLNRLYDVVRTRLKEKHGIEVSRDTVQKYARYPTGYSPRKK